MKYKNAKKTLDTYFSQFIRLRDCSDEGFSHCCTCGKFMFWKECDAGHFVSRNHLNTRFDERNVHSQCKKCNRFEGGRQYEHSKFIDKKYGEGMAEKIYQKSRLQIKIAPFEYEEKIKHYREEVKRLKKEKRL